MNVERPHRVATPVARNVPQPDAFQLPPRRTPVFDPEERLSERLVRDTTPHRSAPILQPPRIGIRGAQDGAIHLLEHLRVIL